VVPVAEHREPDDKLDLVARGKRLELLRKLREVRCPDVDDLLRQQDDLRAGPSGVGDHRAVAVEDLRSGSVRPARVVCSLCGEYGDLHRLALWCAV